MPSRAANLPCGPLPPAALATLADPYDPDQRFPYNAMLDASYFAGRYYLYFGPVPAALLALAAPFVDLRDMPDAALALPFALGLTVATGGTLLLLRRLLPSTPSGYVVAAYLVAGLAYPLPALLGRPAVYEAAILAGAFFLMAGLAFAGLALGASRWWPAAGIAWALAAGSRLSLAPAVALLGLTTIVWLLRRRRPLAALGVGVPLATAAMTLGWYNWARFGSLVETGHRYQLAGFDLAGRYDQFFRPRLPAPERTAVSLLATGAARPLSVAGSRDARAAVWGRSPCPPSCGSSRSPASSSRRRSSCSPRLACRRSGDCERSCRAP
ncbi:MAG: hypothetical protein KatS3mg060_0457 [Dehalococcoidia bacterium]|nr:MAG: hypothetical protein KatS3mg060_0457 [Dehalococcoidia bacterium]